VLHDKKDMPSIMKQRERVEVVKYCKFVDEILTDTPDIIDLDYMAFYQVGRRGLFFTIFRLTTSWGTSPC
jgi:glycerol-3-phosphate cytidylyltransferase-like family protein